MEDNSDFSERKEHTKKNVSSDLHFYSYMKKLQQIKNPLSPLTTSQKSDPNNNPLNLNQSVRQSQQQPIQTSISQPNVADLSTSNTARAQQNQRDFWDVVANFDKKQQEIDNEIKTFKTISFKEPTRNEPQEYQFIKKTESEGGYRNPSFLYNDPKPIETPFYEWPKIHKTETTEVAYLDKDVNFLKGRIAEKDSELERTLKENKGLMEMRIKLENAIVNQSELMNSLKNQLLKLKEKQEKEAREENELKRIQSQLNERKIVRQKCPNSTAEDIHFLIWNSNQKTHSNCSKCLSFKSCRWICKFCEENFCISCVPDCIFDGKCYLQHQLQEEMLGGKGEKRECDRCGLSENNVLYWVDNECALDICKNCYNDLNLTSSGNFIITFNEELKNFFTIEYHDAMMKKINEEEEKRNMNNIESNSYMFLTIFLMMYVPFFSLFLGKFIKLFFPFQKSFWRREIDPNLPEDQRRLLKAQERNICAYYKQNFSKDNLMFLLKLLSVLICFTILIVPSCLVIVIQVWCLIKFEKVDDTITYDSFFILKYLIVLIFILMICQEASKTINALYFVSTVFVIDTCLQFITLVISLAPILSFLLIIWYLCYIQMISIIGDEDLIDVIQNFAGFFILLEFGRITMQFLKAIHFNDFFDWITSSDLMKISLNVGGMNFKVEKTLSAILHQDEFFMEEIYSELKNKSTFFQYSKILFIAIGVAVINYFFYVHLSFMNEAE